MYGFAILIYRDSTRPRDRVGSVGLWAFVIGLVVIYVSTTFGPPPPNERAIAITALAGWLLPFWAAWFDRHREAIV
jgi:hypothetical protein